MIGDNVVALFDNKPEIYLTRISADLFDISRLPPGIALLYKEDISTVRKKR
jgi:hypothetical protein